MKPWRTQPHAKNTQFTVSSVPLGGPLRTLDDLLAHAENHASFSMRSDGRLQPTLFIIGNEGPQVLTPSSLADEAAKDDFAIVARLLCVAKAATAVVLASEAWVASARPGQSLYADQRPSEAPDRQEFVILMGEERTALRQRFLPILRGATGGFAEFGTSESLRLDTVQGRFAQFLASAIPSVEQSATAEAFLRNIGVAPGPRHTTSRPPRYRM
jgi:hypothetical protein